MNKGGRRRRRARRRVRSPISGGSSSAAFLFPCSHLDSGDHNESSVDVRREVSRRREKRSSREEPVSDRSRRDGTAERIHRSDSKLIFLSWADRLRSLEKIAEDFGARFSPAPLPLPPPLVPFPLLPLRLSRSELPLSLFPPSAANDSCCDRCQDASLPRAITQWPPLFLRGYHAPIAVSADPREIMDCHDALSITGPRTSADTPGYPGVASRFRRATIPR